MKPHTIPFTPEPLPTTLNTPDFAVAWAEWLDYKAKDLKQPMSARAQRMALRRMEAWGPVRAVAAIQWSIEREWEGIFENHNANGPIIPATGTPSLVPLRSVRDINDVLQAKLERVNAILGDYGNYTYPNGQKQLKPEPAAEVARLRSELNELKRKKASIL